MIIKEIKNSWRKIYFNSEFKTAVQPTPSSPGPVYNLANPEKKEFKIKLSQKLVT